MAILPLTPKPSGTGEPPPVAAALARYDRAVGRFRDTVATTSSWALNADLVAAADTLDDALDRFEERAAEQASLADPAPIHRAATLCAHATELVMLLNDRLWRRDQAGARGYLDDVRAVVRTIAELPEGCP